MIVESRQDGERAAEPDLLDIGSYPLLGRVTRLDRNRFEVELSEPGLASRVTVSDLVAVPTGSDSLIGLVEAVQMRSARSPGVAIQVMPVGRLSPGRADAPATFRRGASGYPHVGSACHLIEGEQLHRFMSLLGRGVAPEEQLVLGRYAADRETAAIADGNRFFQRHLALIGSTGAGKSWAVALMLERASRLSHPNLIVLDLHGEYTPLSQDGGEAGPIAQSLRVAGPGDVAHPSDDVLFLPYWLLERDELMALVLNPDDPDAADHVFRYTEHVQTLKRVSLVDQGRTLALATFTVDSPIPYRLEHLAELLRRDDLEKIPQPPSLRLEPGPYFGRLTSFISRLQARAEDPRYGFIFDPPEQTYDYDWLAETATKLLGDGTGGAGIKLVDLSEVPSAIVPLVAGVLARLVYDIQFWMDPARRTPVCLICDEAHLYLPSREDSGAIHRAALEIFEAIAKEGRKYGVGLVVVTQRPADVSSTILSQCNNFVVMRLTNDHDRAMVERLIPEHLAGVTGVLPALEPGEAVVVGDALLLPTRVEFDPPDVKPASTTQPYWTLWTERPPSREAIADGVEALRNQLRAPD